MDEIAKTDATGEAETIPKPRPPRMSSGSDLLAALRRYFPGVLVSLTIAISGRAPCAGSARRSAQR
jgi:hypothetical protein